VNLAGKIIFAGLILLHSCKPSVDHISQAPADLIPRDEMVDIIVDMRLLDAIISTKQKSKDKDVEDTKYFLYNSILEKYGITNEQFESSHSYYQQDLTVMDEIYGEAIARLSKMKGEIDKE
jgi:hypothetical protein